MEQTTCTDTVTSDTDVEKILARLTAQITNNVHNLHVLREEVSAEGQRHRNEEINLCELQKESEKEIAEEKRARTDEDISYNQYEMQLRELQKDINKHREQTITAEANEALLAALRDLVAQKDNELVALRRDKWKPNIKPVCIPAGLNAATKNQITSDLKEMSEKVKQLQEKSQHLKEKMTKAGKIVNKVCAYAETEENAMLEMESRVNDLSMELRKEEALLSATKKVHPISVQPKSSLQQQSSRRSSILKELEEEKVRSENLTKELSEVVQLATKYAADREQWLQRQFPGNEEKETRP